MIRLNIKLYAYVFFICMSNRNATSIETKNDFIFEMLNVFRTDWIQIKSLDIVDIWIEFIEVFLEMAYFGTWHEDVGVDEDYCVGFPDEAAAPSLCQYYR